MPHKLTRPHPPRRPAGFRELRVAGIQVLCENGQAKRNLQNAEKFVELAACERAQLVLCPEFLATGYRFDRKLWDAAERAGGRTEQWLTRMARRHGLFIGASYLEADGEDFFNTFALARPDGEIAGRVRKQTSAFFERGLCRAGSGSRIIETELGKIGIGICFDCYTGEFVREMYEERPDLLLMPHSSSVPPHQDRLSRTIREAISHITRRCARLLGVPAIMINKAGPAPFRTSIPPLPWLRVRLEFPGSSQICDWDGTVLASLGQDEGLLGSTLLLETDAKPLEALPPMNFWSLAPRQFPNLLSRFHWLVTRIGEVQYRWSRRRRVRAIALTSSMN